MKKVKLLGILLLSGIFLSSCSSNNSKISELEKENQELKSEIKSLKSSNSVQSDTESTSSSEQSEKTNDKVYGLNEEAILDDLTKNEHLYSLKIIKATTNLSVTDDIYTNGKPENTVEVTYEYKNYAMTEPMKISVQFLHAYDENGTAGTDSNMMDGQTDVSQGRSSQSTTWFTMSEPMTNKNEIEIEYVNDFSLGYTGAIKFKVPLEH